MKINHLGTRVSTNAKVLKGMSGMVKSQKAEILKNTCIVDFPDRSSGENSRFPSGQLHISALEMKNGGKMQGFKKSIQ